MGESSCVATQYIKQSIYFPWKSFPEPTLLELESNEGP